MPIVSANITAQLRAVQTGSNDFGGPSFTPEMQAAITLTGGTVASAADILWMDQRTVASATNDDLDLAGVLADAFGATVAAVELVALFIINAPASGAANTTNLTVGVGSNPVVGWLGGTNPTLGPIRPGGVLLRAEYDVAGMCTVTAGTGDILRIANSSGASATYQIAILARTA